MPAINALLDSLIDYAGLFPPAQLDMSAAVRNYARTFAGPHRAALGRFVVPLARLDDFATAHATLPLAQQTGWCLSVLATPDPIADAKTITAFNARRADVRIVSVETKAAAPADIAQLVAPFSPALEIWFELAPAAPDLPALLDAVRATDRGAKLRTGGVTPEAFPSSAHVARFLRECHVRGIVAKITAGLHHPLRGEYRLTYDAGSANAAMFGFVNVFLAAALVRAGGTEADVIALLEERDAAAFSFSSDALAWRGHSFAAADLRAMRQTLCRSFGSCSFDEPIEGLQQFRWI